MPDFYQLSAWLLVAIFRRDPISFAEKCLRLVFGVVTLGLPPAARLAWRGEFWLEYTGRAQRWINQGLDDAEIGRRLLGEALDFAIRGWGARGAYGKVYRANWDNIFMAGLGWHLSHAWSFILTFNIGLMGLGVLGIVLVGVCRKNLRASSVIEYVLSTINMMSIGFAASGLVATGIALGQLPDNPLIASAVGYPLALILAIAGSHLGRQALEQSIRSRLVSGNSG